MKKPINVISAFDGISCLRVALDRANIPVDKYFAFEIDKFAIKTSEKNYPDIRHLGDIKNWKFFDQLPQIDLLAGGFPCQSHSIAGNRKGLADPRGQLFYVMAEMFQHYRSKNPNLKFLFENVTKIKKQDLEEINKILGCEPMKFNSAVVSAQNRERLYWSNIPFTVPEDRHIYLKDILEDGEAVVKSYGKYIPHTDKSTCLDASYYKGEDNHGQRTIVRAGTASDLNGHDILKRIYSPEGKSHALTANSGGNLEPKVAISGAALRNQRTRHGIEAQLNIRKDGKSNCVVSSYSEKLNGVSEYGNYRKLSPLECERLQTLPENYTEGVSNSQRYKQIGNGWTVDVIVQFVKNL